MKAEELAKIEKVLNIRLPSIYRETMLKYPFAGDSFANDCLLTDVPNRVFENNHKDAVVPIPGILRPFFVGHDGGELRYFLDLDDSELGLSPWHHLRAEFQWKNW